MTLALAVALSAGAAGSASAAAPAGAVTLHEMPAPSLTGVVAPRAANPDDQHQLGSWWARLTTLLAEDAGEPTSEELEAAAGPTGTGAGSDPEASEVRGPSGTEVTVEEFGADGSDDVDDTAALTEALAGVEPGQQLVFADGANYLTSDLLILEVDDVDLVGAATITSTDEERSSFQIAGDGSGVYGLTFDTEGVSKRWDTWDQQRVHITGDDVVLDGVVSANSAAAGVFVSGGATGFVLNDVTVLDSMADGIHMTQGASNGRVIDPVVRGAGDDGVAVVSYAQDGPASSNIEVIRPVVSENDARGISVVGGTNVRFSDIDITASAAAAVYIAAEAEWGTTSTSGVVVQGGTITGANTKAEIDHGAVLVYASTGTVKNVQVAGLDVVNTRTGASRQLGVVTGDPSAVTEVEFTDITVQGGPVQTVVDESQTLELNNVVADGDPVPAPGTNTAGEPVVKGAGGGSAEVMAQD